MSNHPSQLSPRQRMINMMYLVLTALLALNISNEVLKAFVKIDKTLQSTTENFSDKSQEKYNLFTQAAIDNPTKAKEWKDKAFTVKSNSDEVYNSIQAIYDHLEIEGGVTDEDRDSEGWHEKMAQREKHTTYMINEGHGKRLKGEIDALRDNLLLIVDSSNTQLRKQILKTLSTDVSSASAASNKSWMDEHFNNISLAPVFTYLSQFQSKIRNVESAVVDYLFENIDAGAVKFNKLNAMINASSQYIFLGDSFKADVFVTAFDTTQSPEVLVYKEYDKDGNGLGEPELIPVQGGVGKYHIETKREGDYTWAGVIRVKSDSEIKEYPFKSNYKVAKATAVISPSKMNIFYIGVDNPVEISVPGTDPGDLSVRCSGCKISGRNGKYTATVDQPGKCTVTVSAKGKRIGKGQEFRIDRIPNPTAYVASKNEGDIQKSLLLKTSGISASLRNFPFDLKYKITSYTFTATKGEYSDPIKVRSYRLDDKVKNAIRSLKAGTTITFTNIRAKGPDGTKKCTPISMVVVN